MAGLQDIFSAPPSADELQATGAPAPAGGDDLFAPPSPDELAATAKAQGFNEYEGRGVESAFTRGLARSALMLPALPAEIINLGSDAVQYLGSQAASFLDPRVKPMKWSETSKTSDIPILKHLGAESLYKNVLGPDALNIYPHRRPDETTAESVAGTAGEVLAPGVAGRLAVARSLTTPQLVQSANRYLAAETTLGTIGTEVGGAIDKAQGGDGTQGRFVGGMAALAPSVATMAGQTTKFLLRGGQQGAADINSAINASDSLNDLAGNTYTPTTTQRIIDGVFGGSGRNLDLTAGQAAPRRGLIRTIERVAAYMPGGYRVVADKIASQVENAARNVAAIANRQVQRFNARAAAENQSRVPAARYTMQQTGRPPQNALETPVPYIQGVSDDAAGAAVERGLNERVAVNENVRRIAEAGFQTRMPADTQISMDNTINALERLEVRLPGSPAVSQGTLRSPVIGNMRNELIADAQNGPNGSVTIPFGTIRTLRTRVGEFLNGDANALGPSRMSEADARSLYAALSEDMATAARQAGPDTWASWQRAQNVTRTAVEVAGEARNALNRQTMEGVEQGIASGEGSRVQAVMDALNDRERDLVVANIFRKWGLAKAGAQDAAGEAWSFDSWLTNLNKAREKGSLQALTRSTDSQLNRAIEDLTALADRVRQRARFMPNPSGTGRVAIAAGTPIAAAFAAYTNPMLAAAVIATGYVAPNLISRLMVNPRFIRWLARSDEVSAASMPGHILRLGSMAQQPEMAEAVKAYTEALVEQFEKGDALDKAAMVDPTPISETARQIRDYAIGGKELSGSNLMASAGLIGMAAIGMGPGSKMLKAAVKDATIGGERVVAYRGLSQPFDPEHGGTQWYTNRPESATEAAYAAASTDPYRTGANVVRHEIGLGRALEIDMKGKSWDDVNYKKLPIDKKVISKLDADLADQDALVEAAKEAGYDTVVFRNFVDNTDGVPETVYAVTGRQAAKEAEKAQIAAAKAARGYPDQGHWQDLEGAMAKTRDTSSEHTIGAQRAERSTASTRARPEDQAAIDKALLDAKLSSVVKVKEAGADGVEIEREVTQYGKGAKAAEQAIRAAIRKVRDQFPEGEWQRITPRKISLKADRKGNLTPEIEWKSESDYNLTGGFRKGTPEYQARVMKAADNGVQIILEVLRRANAGDKAAQTIIRQMGWYREFTKKGFDAFGGFFPVTRDLLSASSPNTAVAQNYVFAQKGGRALTQGHFDEKMGALGDNMTGNTGPNAIPDNIKITQPSGSWFGMNSGNMMNAIRERWLQKEPGQAPKARQFAANLGGLDLRATIDVWAARFLNRMNGGKPVPIPAEQGVSGALDAKGMFSTGDFGFGQAVFANIATKLNKSGALKSELKKLGYTHITPADLQALTWFIEKEHWTKNNWTSAAGEGGSFEQMLDLDPLVRHQAGFSIQRDAPPSDAEVMKARNQLERTLSSEKDVRMFRAHPTRGQYGQDTERSFDLEIVAKPGWDQTEYRRKVVQMAKDNGQKDVFFSRRLSPSEAATNANARPGVEIYTRGRLTPAEMDGIMQKFRDAGIDGFTFVTETRKAERMMGGSDPATYHGLRLQVIPEFEMMFDDAARAAFAKDPAALDKHLSDKLSKMLDVLDSLQGNPRIVDARTHHYDTEVIHQTEYDDFLAGRDAWGRPGANEAGAGPTGSGGQGRSRYENAARRDRALGKR